MRDITITVNPSVLRAVLITFLLTAGVSFVISTDISSNLERQLRGAEIGQFNAESELAACRKESPDA